MSFPQAPSEYAKEPFDPSVVAFKDNDGRTWRYMNTPLDETYLAEPIDHFLVGTIPPEEREIRDTLVAATVMRRQVSIFQFWWSQFFKPTKAYLRSREYFRRLDQLCGRTPEHRAAFCRLATSKRLPPFICADLKRIVTKHDRARLHQGDRI
ncbi:hypothetical protein [Duganella vulcania]|uniref:Uncharacterized protein n=1 Tax=Duganella vulcania TaxID=2692166 RepID=A0A845GFB6_9BURK|nr:hypothetical protein [Duganella vulcania]MYM92631.1 hypothetical protein [Duganella vulcania]